MSDPIHCPHCGHKLYEPDWVDRNKLLNIILPFYVKGKTKYQPSTLNGVVIRGSDSKIIYNMINKRVKKIKGKTAERILLKSGLDHTVLYD
jgi:hypothetical protein